MGEAYNPEEILKEKQAKRAALRTQFWKEVTNPHRHATGEGGHIFDPALQRYIATYGSQYDYYKPTFRTHKWAIGLTIIPIAIYFKLMKDDRDAKEHSYRTGQVAYKDRKFKFI